MATKSTLLPSMAAATRSLFRVQRANDPEPATTMPMPRFHTSLAALAAGPTVQRKYTGCAEEDKEIRRQMEETEDREEDITVQPKLETEPFLQRQPIEGTEEENETIRLQVEDTEDREEEATVQARLETTPSVQRQSIEGTEEENEPVRYQMEETGDREKETTVQPKLEVGPARDGYEREADSIASRVMVMPSNSALGASPAAESVQRACASCAADNETDMIRRSPDEESGDEEIRAKTKDNALGTHLGASGRQLTSGGSPLPSKTLEFFEARMGRDLSKVRVHGDSESSHLNKSIRARAFTYANHIWLGRGESAQPSFTMAHELAHVMQQSAPGPVGPGFGAEDPADVTQSDDRVQRAIGHSFYQDKRKPLPESHDEVLEWLTVQDKNLYGEVPVPNANARGAQSHKKNFGRADLVRFTSKLAVPVGISFAACPAAQHDHWYCVPFEEGGKKFKPTTLDEAKIDGKAQHIIKSGKAWGKHEKSSRPRFGPIKGANPRMGFVRDAGGLRRAATPKTGKGGSVPAVVTTDIKMGDVKAAAFEGARKKALGQIVNYIDGFGKTRKLYSRIAESVEQKRKAGASNLPRPLTPWNITVGLLEKIKGVDKISRVTKKPRELVVSSWDSSGKGGQTHPPENPKNTPKGHLYVWRETASKYPGAWSYLWAPDDHPTAREFKKLEGDKTQAELASSAECLKSALMLTPKVKGTKTRAKPAVASKAPGCLVRKRPMAHRVYPTVQRVRVKDAKAPATSDPFKMHYNVWKVKQGALQAANRAYGRSPEGKKRVAVQRDFEARRNIAAILPGGKLPGQTKQFFSEKEKKALEANEKTQFWIDLFGNKKGKNIGLLRLRLGRLFVWLVGAYTRTKEKIKSYFKKLKPKKPGGGVGKVALKLAAKILGTMGLLLYPKIRDALMQCVDDGFRKTLDSFFGDGPVATLREKIANAEKQAEEFRTKTLGGIETLVNTIRDRIMMKFEGIKEGAKYIGDLIRAGKAAFTAVRLAICAAGGIESAGLACVVSAADWILSKIGLSPLEAIAGRLLSTCMGQTLIAKALYALDSVKNLPGDFVNWIIELVKPKLPKGVQGLLCDKKSIEIKNPKISEITCGKNGSPKAVPGPDANGKGAENFRMPDRLKRIVERRVNRWQRKQAGEGKLTRRDEIRICGDIGRTKGRKTVTVFVINKGIGFRPEATNIDVLRIGQDTEGRVEIDYRLPENFSVGGSDSEGLIILGFRERVRTSKVYSLTECRRIE
jgi:hypothetical protein